MSSSPQNGIGTGFVPLAVSKTTFLGLVWGSLWISFAFLLGRAYIRWAVYRRFFADDGMVLLAWILTLVNAALWQSMVDYLYLIYAVSVGAVQPPADLMSVFSQYTHRTFAVTILNIFSLWSIKTSFLIFFDKMGKNVRGHNTVWWAAAIACAIGLAISIGVLNYKCIIGPPAEALAKCSTPSSARFMYTSFRLQAACDVITDAFILAVPIRLLWNVSISPRSKLALLALFSLTIFTMIVAILKVTLALRTRREDNSWLYMWAAVESAVAIIIASAVSYRAIAGRSYKNSANTEETLHRRLRIGTTHGTTSHGTESHVQTGKSSSDSTLNVEVVPLDAIRVNRDYEVIAALNLPPTVHKANSNI